MLNKKLIAVIAVVVVVIVAAVSVFAVLNLQEAAKPRVEAVYYGENKVPSGLEENFPVDTVPAGAYVNYYYSWQITAYNLDPTNGWGDVIKNFLKSEIQNYPQLSTYTLLGDTYVIGGSANLNADNAKICHVIFTNVPLTGEQIQSLTDDMNAQLGPALIAYYS